MIRPVGLDEVMSRMSMLRSLSGASGMSVAGGRLGAMPSSASTATATTTGARTPSTMSGGSGNSFAEVLASAASSTTTSAASATAPTYTYTSPVSSGAGPVDGVPYSDLFNAAGARYGVAPKVLAAVAKVESSYHPDAVSGAGAQGMMQLMPDTAASLGVDPFDPASAIDGAARLLASFTDRFGSVDLALAAYNVGPGAVARDGGIRAGSQAERYVNAVHTAMGGL